MNITPYKCPKCGYVWIYRGNSTIDIGCPRCKGKLLGQKVGLAELTAEQYADAKGQQLLHAFENGLVKLGEDIEMLQALKGGCE